ncbi:MAG TPA: hypothetical protein VK933_16055 [Longimicrobiales bacterium]|nr:hypothetical protein [Longimicrobiales bacterium]
MVREIAIAMVVGAGLAGAAEGQQSIGVSAVVLERAEAEVLDVGVRSVGARLRVEAGMAAAGADTRLLRSTWVRAGGGVTETTIPVRVREGGTLRLERRGVGAAAAPGEKIEAGASLLIDAAGHLTVTRVIASNS